ncbi:MAG: hypothetical protein DRJ03_23390 [Chloroflexi bacterium]|nr:MAG: hypothetical protein DRI81_15375 [Chloroflexota bacterium]RLC79500.1 MAG: hypothetical protein DRJ03_23390 [Chloroflexota bacterium]
MIIHVRVREGVDDDIAAWYGTQVEKSDAVRQAIRAHMQLQHTDTLEAMVRQVVACELARLPDVVAVAVREALAGYQLTPAQERESGPEDPELAARLDAQLDDLFGE